MRFTIDGGFMPTKVYQNDGLCTLGVLFINEKQNGTAGYKHFVIDWNLLIKTQEAIEQIKDYIQQRGGNYNFWYVGICQGAHDIIFDVLKMSSQFWMYIETESPQIAKEVLDYFVNTVGAKKDAGSTDHYEISSTVYVYKKAHTSQTKD